MAMLGALALLSTLIVIPASFFPKILHVISTVNNADYPFFRQFSQASEHRRSLPLNHNYFNRRQTVPTRLPGGWTSKGCVVWVIFMLHTSAHTHRRIFYSDSTVVRTLDGASFTNTTGMTVESCIGFCSEQSFIYAGVEFSQVCVYFLVWYLILTSSIVCSQECCSWFYLLDFRLPF